MAAALVSAVVWPVPAVALAGRDSRKAVRHHRTRPVKTRRAGAVAPAALRHRNQVRNLRRHKARPAIRHARLAGDPGVTIADFQFSPGSITIQVGNTITW